MRQLTYLAMILCPAVGCASMGPPPMVYENPALMPPINRDYFWDQLVDVVDDYFHIAREDRVRLVNNMLTLGRIETEPELGATLLEPWRKSSVNYYERLESTLQTIRRQAIIQVVPTENGYLVDVVVYKYLEDLRRPEHANAGDATFRNDDSLDRYNDQTHSPTSMANSFPTFGQARGPIGPQPFEMGWIPVGRDTALEQKILAQLMSRIVPGGVPCNSPAPCNEPSGPMLMSPQ